MKQRASRRRFLKLAAAAGIAGFEPIRRSWISPARAQASLWADVPPLDGTLVFDDAARVAIATDHSNLFQGIPAAVLRPGSVRDVVRMVEFANKRSLKIVMKGRGHSQNGQSQ